MLLKEMLSESPVVVIERARQVGKSTLAQQAALAVPSTTVTLDDPNAMSFASSDPVGFLHQASDRLLIIDEAQREPSLVLALKREVDQDHRPAKFLITGSADFLKVQGSSDSLAGRAEILSLNPLSVGELEQRSTPEDWVNWILAGAPGDVQVEPVLQTKEAILAGGYPVPLQRSEWKARNRWYSAYVRELSSRDAAELAGGAFSATLSRLLSLLASGGQSELVIAKFARQLGVSEGTARQYLALAEQMYLVNQLPAWGMAMSARVVRRPKASLNDTGLSAYLAGMTLEKANVIGGREYFGALTEQFVVAELRKQQTWSEQPYRLYHYRQRNEEIDVVVELFDGRIILIEVKSGMTAPADAWRKLDSAIRSERIAAKVVLYLGDQVQRRTGGSYLLPICSLWRHPAI
ncbi:MAG: DUF4143 domain-containing protein [Arcanobacterium sp.]|nr:DUF4143 domain-containing protein [Arcanobacterium sp.]